MSEGAIPPELLRLFHLAAEQNETPIAITDRSGRIVYVNPAEERVTGYSVKELIGATPRILKSGQTPPEVYRDLWATILEGRTWEGELINRRKDGELYEEGLRITPLCDETGHVTHFFTLAQDLSARREAAMKIEYLSTFDHLTGLPNRDHFMTNLVDSVREAAAHGRRLTLLHIDLDRFKACNDSLGATVADRLLVAIAERLKGLVRRDDVLARLAGDEFALLLWDTALDPGRTDAIGRIRNAISEPVGIDGKEVSLTASIGAALYPGDGHDGDSLLRSASAAMVVAKKEGGDTVRHSKDAPSAQAGMVSRFDLATQLRRVADRDELRLHFQPQISLASGEIVGAEALLRWQHPEKGLVPPGHFIPFAEETGIIVPISEWVVRAACRQARAWLDEGLPPLKIGINLSVRHFRYGDLPDTIASALAESAIEARHVELELTESVMMHDAAGAIRIVDRLKSLGVRLSLDDFGTGYSSLAYLSRFAIDQIKIDQSFVRDVTTNPVNASIVNATIAMVHQLGKSVIAEGVETEGQLNFLRRHDCDEMQGYYFSKPLPAGEFAAMLRDGRRLDFGARPGGESSKTLLLVDDEPNILNALKRLFRREGYRVLSAGSAAEALDLLALQPVQVILSDQRMPEMGGVEFLSRVKDLYPDTIRIVLSGYSEISTVTDAINRGAIWKYFTKPWDDDDLREEIRRAFRAAAVAATGTTP
ncbi:MAG: EAL domain-containing protein [Candidatus Nitricoxidivorans perseverans]|uniref:EAL domain-containing protein n=1 Tax=Candidatus Nitricoxidivorans perseverans TaxID=2975601 RepID=A0AA49FLJ7_9PROT|nr:MAG: EAL domain-containing protein [Candidatus Nitricoxidivorans perseverans]